MRYWLLFILVYPILSFGQSIRDTSIVIVDYTFLFESGKAQLLPQDQLKIDSFIQLYKSKKDSFFKVEAHTDSEGSKRYNENLSSQRVQAITTRMLDSGVDPDHIKSQYFGELRPRASNEDKTGKSANRRAELKLLVKKKITTLNGKVVDKETNVGIPAEVSLRSKDFNTSTITDSTGYFSIEAPFMDVVALELFSKNHFFETRMLKVTSDIINKPPILPLPKLAVGRVYIMDNLFFSGNKSILVPMSEKEPQKILKLLQRNQDVCVEIAGNINLPNKDSTEVDDIHYRLSVARALEIYDFLTDNGIDKNRLLAKGYGNWRMLFPNATNEREMSRNRRVEIKVLDCVSTRTLQNDSIPDQAFFRTSDNLINRN